MKPGLFKKVLSAISIIAMAIGMMACDEETPEIIKGAGVYEFSSATLIDGDVNNTETTDLVLMNVPLGVTIEPTLTIPAGETVNTTLFVNGVLSGAAPCEDAITATYQINLKKDYSIAFICTSEGDISEEIGNWQLTEDKLTMYVSVSFSPVLIPIILDNVEISDTGISGTVNSFPVVKYVLYDDLVTPMPLAGPIDGDISNTSPGNLNLQYISISIDLAKVD